VPVPTQGWESSDLTLRRFLSAQELLFLTVPQVEAIASSLVAASVLPAERIGEQFDELVQIVDAMRRGADDRDALIAITEGLARAARGWRVGMLAALRGAFDEGGIAPGELRDHIEGVLRWPGLEENEQTVLAAVSGVLFSMNHPREPWDEDWDDDDREAEWMGGAAHGDWRERAIRYCRYGLALLVDGGGTQAVEEWFKSPPARTPIVAPWFDKNRLGGDQVSDVGPEREGTTREGVA
jgi:hypothetical protein